MTGQLMTIQTYDKSLQSYLQPIFEVMSAVPPPPCYLNLFIYLFICHPNTHLQHDMVTWSWFVIFFVGFWYLLPISGKKCPWRKHGIHLMTATKMLKNQVTWCLGLWPQWLLIVIPGLFTIISWGLPVIYTFQWYSPNNVNHILLYKSYTIKVHISAFWNMCMYFWVQYHC